MRPFSLVPVEGICAGGQRAQRAAGVLAIEQKKINTFI
jgi:hypothetical protein